MKSKKIFYNVLAFAIYMGLFTSCSYGGAQSLQKYNKSIEYLLHVTIERDIIVLSLQIILGGNMFGLVISLLIIALVVIIKNIRIMNNNLTRFVLEVPTNGLIYNQ